MHYVKTLSVAVLLFVLGCAQPGTAPVVPDAAPDIRGLSPAFVAIWEVEDLTPGSTRYSGIGGLLSDRIMEVFSESDRFLVVERQKLLLALEELNIGTSQLAAKSQRLAAGRITGAQYMVFGAFQAYGKRIRVDLRLVKVETGKIVKTASETVADDNILNIVDAAGQTAMKLLGRL